MVKAGLTTNMLYRGITTLRVDAVAERQRAGLPLMQAVQPACVPWMAGRSDTASPQLLTVMMVVVSWRWFRVSKEEGVVFSNFPGTPSNT